MSKAFTRESDDVPEKPLARPIQPGQKDYLTPDGAQRVRDELKQLTESPERNSPQDKQRAAQLQELLATAEVVPVPAQPWEQVLFGASVTVRDANGVDSCYRIVGREEADLERNWVSWTSPIARALLKTRLGQQIRFRIPAGEQVWDIVRIEYQ